MMVLKPRHQQHARCCSSASAAAPRIARRHVLLVRASAAGDASKKENMHVRCAIIGGGPAGHTAATYLARAELQPVLFEGFMANGIAPGGQLTTTTYIENFPGFTRIMGHELCDKFREQSVEYGTRVFTETVDAVDLSAGSPFRLETGTKVVLADALIIATGAAAKRLRIPGSDEANGFWNKGISACAVCDGSSPLFRNRPVGVVGGGDAAMEEALFLSRYASKVYIIHRFDYLEASKVMQRRAMDNRKIEIIWQHELLEAYGNEEDCLGGVVIRDTNTQETRRLELSGLFFAIGHAPATAFLNGQLALDEFNYIITQPGRTTTSVPGVFAAGDVQDREWRQAATAAGSGCMAALEVERYLQALDSDAAASSGVDSGTESDQGGPVTGRGAAQHEHHEPAAAGRTSPAPDANGSSKQQVAAAS